MGLGCRLALIGLLGSFAEVAAEVSTLHFGGTGGAPWSEWTLLNLMVEDATPALQPLELRPDENVITQLPYWERSRYRRPVDPLWRSGMPRIWQGTGTSSRGLQFQNFMKFIDGDINTAFVAVIMPAGEVFFTLDMGLQIPAERFVVVPPEGVDPGTQIPYRPFWAFEGYALTASNDEQLVNTQEPKFLSSYTYLGQVFPIAGFAKSVAPLDIVLADEEQNFDPIIEVEFPLRYLRFFRFRPFPDGEADMTLGSSPQAGPPLGSGFYSRSATLGRILPRMRRPALMPCGFLRRLRGCCSGWRWVRLGKLPRPIALWTRPEVLSCTYRNRSSGTASSGCGCDWRRHSTTRPGKLPPKFLRAAKRVFPSWWWPGM